MAKKPFFCDDCGMRNTPDSKYCKECGAKIHVAYQTLALSDHDRVDDAVQQDRLAQFLDMAFWHTEAGNHDAAARACEAALAINANSTTAHSLLGCLYEKKGDDAHAIEHFERVLALNPDSEADRAKLVQLREGVHAQPVRPSRVYRWLPPVLATARFSGLAEKIGDLRRPDLSLLPARPTPALAAGAAAILVLAIGLFAIRPAPPAHATASQPAAPRPAAINRSVFAGPVPAQGAEASASVAAPVVLMPPRERTVLPPPTAVAATSRLDPFYRAPTRPAAPAHRGGRTASAYRAGRGGLHALPPLSLAVVPPAGDGPLPPAPVTVPASVRAATSASPYAGVIRHTVVVQRFSGTPSEFHTAGTASADTPTNATDTEAPAPTPHIEITIDHNADSAAGVSAAGTSGGDGTPAGENYQQSAFSLQQQGDYQRAGATYEKAIRAYQAQITAGRDPEAARRGLEACQTGLQICRQGQ